MNELVLVENINPIVVFTEKDNLKILLKKIEDQVLSHTPDLSTQKSRKDIASLAYKISQSKTYLDNSGKELVSEWKNKARIVDESRKQMRDYLDELRDKVRKPLTDWEIAEKARIAKEKLELEIIKSWDQAIIENELFIQKKELEKIKAELAKKEAERIAEKQRIEHERLEEEKRKQREKEQKEYEDRLKKEAEDRAKIEAENRIKIEREAREKSERDRIASEERAKIEKELAVKKAVEETKKKAKEEEEKQKRIQQQILEAEENRIRDIEHRRSIHSKILKSLINNGINEDLSKNLIKEISSGKIPHIKIEY